MRWAHLYFSDVRFLPDVSRHLVTLFSVLISNFGRVIQKTKRVTGGTFSESVDSHVAVSAGFPASLALTRSE